MLCESCQQFMHPLAGARVIFNDGEEFIVCMGCADQQKGGVLEALNRICYWNAGSLATT